jgi:hypothetical protein
MPPDGLESKKRAKGVKLSRKEKSLMKAHTRKLTKGETRTLLKTVVEDILEEKLMQYLEDSGLVEIILREKFMDWMRGSSSFYYALERVLRSNINTIARLAEDLTIGILDDQVKRRQEAKKPKAKTPPKPRKVRL